MISKSSLIKQALCVPLFVEQNTNDESSIGNTSNSIDGSINPSIERYAQAGLCDGVLGAVWTGAKVVGSLPVLVYYIMESTVSHIQLF